MQIFFFVAGLALLIAGGEALVRGASRIASALGVSPLIIGLTVVAFGTSSPEFAVSIHAAITGSSGVAIGNIIGSNIFNVLMILGVSALITPLIVSQQLIRLDVPLMIAVSILVFVLAADGAFTVLDGALLFLGLITYTVFLFYLSRKESSDVDSVYAKALASRTATTQGQWVLHIFFVVGGLGLLVLGARWFVDGAVALAQFLGLSEVVIGLTIVAAGTSLPEVVTSIIAAIRRERDIAVGNIVGSNLFNLLGVLGLAALLAPEGIPVSMGVLHFDIPVMLAVAVACLPIFAQSRISRWQGGLFFGYYIAYTAYLVLDATGHDALPMFSAIMAYFIIPLTVVTLLAIAVRAVRHQGHQGIP
jgi:cation:H+ antiporter